MNLDQRTGLDDSDYLNIRFSKLNCFDKNVLLMIHEIYFSKRVESNGGQVFGLTESCAVAATALCFIIKSLSTGHQNIVGVYPIKNLKAETQKACFDKVMLLVYEIEFNIIGICVTNPANGGTFLCFLLPSQARINGEGCGRKGIRCKTFLPDYTNAYC